MSIINKFTAFYSRQEISKPVFILGCGRSGTTTLGTAMSYHKNITYLNERRDLWFQAYPQTDIWTSKATARKGRVQLTGDDTNVTRSSKLRRSFHKETLLSSKPFLIEKLPINNFRIDFLNKIFPDAKFIHIYRNGLEVSRSIEVIAENGGWYGANNYKWEQLKGIAESQKATADLPGLCNSFFEKGLMEWRLGTEAVVEYLSGLPSERYIEVSYASFTRDPMKTTNDILSFVDAGEGENVVDFVRKNVRRRSSDMGGHELTPREKKIGGFLLPLSIDNTVLKLTNSSKQ